LRAESAAGQKLAAALETELGSQFVQCSDLGPMVEEDAVLQILMERAGHGDQAPVVVPCEATAALGMVLLRDYGILTVNTHGQPGARVSLRLKPTTDALSRVGGADAVVRAVTESLDQVAKIITDRDAMARLILGE
jgi:L-seryl-tRNA(Ser) seleniumtransferase